MTAEAAVDVPSVRHLLLVSSYLPEPGQSLSSFGPESPAPFLQIDPEAGTFGVRPELLVETFLSDCPADIGTEAGRRLVQQSLAVLQQPVRSSACQQVPTTYLVCTEDRGTPVAAQREFARRASTAVEMTAGHHPFLAQPEAVAELVLGLS